MSMISLQIDELRQMADGGATYRDAREVMLRAADTIWELRDDLQRANAENAKLREQLGSIVSRSFRTADKMACLEAENAKLREELADAPKCEACEAMLDCDECLRADGSHKERRRLSFENAKLRELVRDMWALQIALPYGAHIEIRDRMRELGIEVNDG